MTSERWCLSLDQRGEQDMIMPEIHCKSRRSVDTVSVKTCQMPHKPNIKDNSLRLPGALLLPGRSWVCAAFGCIST